MAKKRLVGELLWQRCPAPPWASAMGFQAVPLLLELGSEQNGQSLTVSGF